MSRLSFDDEIKGLRGKSVGDFWSWAYSDMLSNTNRSVLAEFIVGTALGVVDKSRVEWDAVDLRYRAKGIEVKCSGYLQSWAQDRESVIQFDIAKKQSWDSRTNTFDPEVKRSADCYVFCLHTDRIPNAVEVLDVSRWAFFVLATGEIDGEFGDQKSIRLSRLESVCKPVIYAELKSAVDNKLGLFDAR